MSAPRSAPRLLVGTFELYLRYPFLFLFLAAGVIVPYELIALTATGTGAFSRTDTSAGAQLFLTLADFALITPLVSALHIHAVAEVKRDQEPRIGPVTLQGLRVLPVVAAATIASWLGITVGFALLIVPGLILLLRWAVVAQTAAIEHEGWLPALRHSGRLTAGNYGHIAVFLVILCGIATVPFIIGGIAFGHHGTGTASFLTGLAIRIFTASFTALAGALLYYDLMARWEEEPQPASAQRTSFDPRAHSDLDRPKGWYVDPSSPSSMRHWGGSERPEWSSRTRTPRKIRRAWRTEDKDGSPG